MARIYVGGKPVEVSAAELPEFLPLADSSAPDDHGRTAIARPPVATASEPAKAVARVADSTPQTTRGAFASLSPDAQRLLQHLASIHPKWTTDAELRDALGVADQRALGGLMVGISRRVGRGTWVQQDDTRRGNEREYRYRLTARAMRIAQDDGWAPQQAVA